MAVKYRRYKKGYLSGMMIGKKMAIYIYKHAQMKHARKIIENSFSLNFIFMNE